MLVLLRACSPEREAIVMRRATTFADSPSACATYRLADIEARPASYPFLGHKLNSRTAKQYLSASRTA